MDPLIQFVFWAAPSHFLADFDEEGVKNAAQGYILLRMSWSPKLPETSPLYSPPLLLFTISTT